MTYIIEALRTPRGRGNARGALAGVAPVELLAQPLRALAAAQPQACAEAQDVIVGCVTQHGGQAGNIARLAALQAGWSDSVPGVTLNRYCASGLSATLFAALCAQSTGAVAVSGGIEMMSNTPMGSDAAPLFADAELQHRLNLVPIGLAADAVATLEGFSREQCDAYALASQQRAQAALAQGHFRSLVPVTDAQGTTVLAQDETPRSGTTAESLARTPLAFDKFPEFSAKLCAQLTLPALTHMHHAANAPATADGASACLLAGEAAVRRLGLQPRARIVSHATLSVNRTLALTGAVDATQWALQRAGLDAQDIDLFEVNESFAALMLHYQRHLHIPHDRLNVNGGAIALGHAMGSTGCALISMALDELERRQQRYAVVALCGATGLAAAAVLERLPP